MTNIAIEDGRASLDRQGIAEVGSHLVGKRAIVDTSFSGFGVQFVIYGLYMVYTWKIYGQSMDIVDIPSGNFVHKY